MSEYKNYPHETRVDKYLEAFDRRKGDLGRRLQDFSIDGQTLKGIFPKEEEAAKILADHVCEIYLGIDPTGPDIHLGHTIPLFFLKQLMLRGHKPVILIGDFTAKIGDPTGKDKTRKPLTDKEIESNMKNYLEQIYKILPKDYFEVKYNSKWLRNMNMEKILELAGQVTVQQMIIRDMFQNRIKEGKPIGLHEFLYPLMQGYDSVAMEIDGEVGGNDQTFNMLVGRDLEKKLIGKDKLVFATQLLVDPTTGKKMSKSEGGLISISDSPNDMFGKVMSVPDEFIRGMFKLCTERSMKWIDENDERIKTERYECKKELAEELVAVYHGKEAAEKAKDEFEKVFSRKEIPTEIRAVRGGNMYLVDFISEPEHQLASSKTEAKRLISEGAVRVNEKVVKEWGHVLNKEDIVQVGKIKFVRVI